MPDAQPISRHDDTTLTLDEPGYEWRREQLLEYDGEWPAAS